MGRWALVIAAVLVAGFVAAAGLFVIRHDWLVEELMEQVHAGEDSPWAAANRQAQVETPDWVALRAREPDFVAMGEALKSAKNADIRQSADGYVAAVTGMQNAVIEQDAEAYRQSFAALKKACNDCHFDGGVGGMLKDE